MSLEIIKDKIKINQLVKRERIESLVEGEITLPDHKPKIENLISLDGEVEITNQLLKGETLIVTGMVKFRTIYTTLEDEDQLIHSLESKTDFREEIALESSYDAKSMIKAVIEHIEYTKLTDKKIGVKAIVDIDSKLQLQDTIEIIKDVKGREGIETLEETLNYREMVGTTKVQNTVKDTFEIEDCDGDIVDILRIDVDAITSESRVVDGKVIVAGSVKCFLLYYSDDKNKTLDYIKEEIPFTHFVEVEGAEQGMDYSLDLVVEDIGYDIRGDINGNLRIIDLETAVSTDVTVYNDLEKEIITDAYSTVKKFEIKSKNIDLTKNLGKENIDETLKQVIDVEEGEIVNLCNIKATSIITDSRVLEEKVIVEGIVELDAVYVGKRNTLNVLKSEIPFKSYLDIEDSNNLDIEVSSIISDISYSELNKEQIEVEISLTNKIELNSTRSIKVVSEAKELDEMISKKDRASIIIYMVQKKDTVWDIAKRYSTTVEDIIATNNIEEDNLSVGDKIIIEKHLDTTLQAYA